MIADDGMVHEMIKKLDQILRKYIFFDDDILYRLTSIYILFTHLYEVFDEVPYLQILGLKASGKSRFGDLLEGLCLNPVNSSEISDASLYRVIGHQNSGLTLIIDEADDLSGSTRRDILLRILRSGYRRNGNVTRCGPSGTVDWFSTFCPKIIINEKGIRDPALESRTIPILMVKTRTHLEKFRFSKAEKEFKEVKDLIGSFLEEYRDTISDHYVSFQGIEGLSDRDEEVWTPILIIAEVLDRALAEPSIKEKMLTMAKKIIVQRKRTQLIGNRDAQILESIQAYTMQVVVLKIDGLSLYVGEDLCRFTKDRWSIPDLKPETVSRILNRFNIIIEIKRPRLPNKGQRSCYVLDTERLLKITAEYF